MTALDWISLTLLTVQCAVQFTNGATRTYLVQSGAVRPEVLRMGFNTQGLQDGAEVLVAESNRWTGVTGLLKWVFVAVYAAVTGPLIALAVFIAAHIAGFIVCLGFARVAGGTPNSTLMINSKPLLAATCVGLWISLFIIGLLD